MVKNFSRCFVSPGYNPPKEVLGSFGCDRSGMPGVKVRNRRDYVREEGLVECPKPWPVLQLSDCILAKMLRGVPNFHAETNNYELSIYGIIYTFAFKYLSNEIRCETCENVDKDKLRVSLLV